MKRLKKIRGLTVVSTHHAEAILAHDIPEAIDDLVAGLKTFTIQKRELIDSGGSQATITRRLRDSLSERNLRKKNVKQVHKVDGIELPSESHEIDHVKHYPKRGRIALEIEWNNKDPFLDRDLENYRKLHQVGYLSVGIIVTRGATLQAHLPQIFIEHYARYSDVAEVPCTEPQRKAIQKRMDAATRRGTPLTVGQSAGAVLAASKFGKTTTHWDKLIMRVNERALGKPCPLILIGIELEKVIDFNPRRPIDVGSLPVDPELVSEGEGLESE